MSCRLATHLLTALFLLAMATAARAQHLPAGAPPTLLGRWSARQVSFASLRHLTDEQLDRVDNLGIQELNGVLQEGSAHLVVEFHADSSYQFIVSRDGERLRVETGTYSVGRSRHLRASSPASPDGSSFHDQFIGKLERRALTLVFLLGPDMPGVAEVIEYKRLGPPPAVATAAR